VRQAAAQTLGQIGDPKAVESLVVALSDENLRVCGAAAEALGKTGDARAIEPLLAMFQRGNCQDALKTLIQIGPSAVEPLVTTLKYSDYGVRLESIKALRDSRAVEPLVMILMSTKSGEVAAALNSLGWQPVNDDQRVPYLIALGRWEEVISMGTMTVEPLLEALWDGGVRKKVAGLLDTSGWKPTDGAQRVLHAIVHDDWKELARLGAVAVEPLLKVFDCWRYCEQEKAAEALGRIGDRRAIKPLVTVFRGNDVYRKKYAAQALKRLGWQPADDTERAILAISVGEWSEVILVGSAAVEALIAALKSGWCDYHEAKQVLRGLKETADERAVKPLLELARDTYLSRVAIEILGQVLGRFAIKVAQEELRAVAGLEGVSEFLRVNRGDFGNDFDVTGPVDCSQVKQLAWQELIRRGLSA
ncbi:MAG: HEAT repeat domain-containing protein, partial [Terriglobia bacterium]